MQEHMGSVFHYGDSFFLKFNEEEHHPFYQQAAHSQATPYGTADNAFPQVLGGILTVGSGGDTFQIGTRRDNFAVVHTVPQRGFIECRRQPH